MTRPIDLVLQRAEQHGLRPSGRGRWRMRGACHGGERSLSVSIAEGDNGAVLLRCWAGCGVDRVAQTLGLDLADLFPDRGPAGEGARAERKPFTARELLEALSAELTVCWIALADVAAGRALDEAGRARAALASERCRALIEELRGVR